MKKGNRIIELQGEAKRNFRNYLGNDKENFISMNGASPAANAAVVSHAQMETRIVDIQNTDESYALAAPLFSAYENIAVPFNGVTDTITGNTAQAGKGIVITWQDYTDAEIKDYARTNPFTIEGMRYNFGDDTQLANKWTRRYKSGDEVSTKPYTPSIYQNLANNISTTLQDGTFFQLIDGKATLFILLSKATNSSTPRTVQIVFNIRLSADVTNILKGKSAVDKFGTRII